ncbi:Ig-like domain-containing protein [Epilithonimonas bovis DSM 19482]|uniref:Ig-like domain-containing protein n=1 Tax=Epilithonimonas bovis DSM 19482 TaxID=1121284 RepID=A0A1U7PYQ1_9FLAO|nr:Ig-like domain-containing protein [Epilithonimonas bovis]SIT97654.1 Ig-like domain-containing protein [Epilithonimonas bovis DSM 19482]
MKHFLLWLFALSVLVSCARVGSPVGGNKDTIPPKMIGSNIDTTRINVPRDIKELRIDFDEYITLKDVSKNLIISPPIKYSKIIPSSTGNKYLQIQWKDTLQANTTYNFNFGNSVVDLNEGNALPYFNFAFSTGSKIDDLYISGTVADALGNEKNSEGKEKNLVVGLYQVKDTMDYRQKPYYITKADPDGYFELNYLTPGKYRIIGFDDENSNSIYDTGKESVAFQKTPIVLDSSISGVKLRIYPSKKLVKYKEMAVAPGGVAMVFEGNPDKVVVKAVGEKPADYKVTHKLKSDSARIWFDATKENIGLTVSENLKFSYDTGAKQDTMSVFYKKPAKDDMTIANPFSNKLAPETDFRFSSNYIINKIQPENWKLESDSISQSFTARISELDSTQVIIKSTFVPGKKYQLTVPKNTVLSFYSKLSESVRFDFQAMKADEFGSFTAHLVNAPSQKFWIQLLNDKNETEYQQYGNQTLIKFTNIRPGSYKLRILVDNNENGYWDSADFATETLSEDAFLFRKAGDKDIMSKINIRPMWEINENWDLTKEEQPVN